MTVKNGVRRTDTRLGVEPWAYLQDVLTRLPSQPTGRLAELLPDKWARTQRDVTELAAPGGPDEVVPPSSG